MKKKILMSLAVLMIGGVLFTGCGSKDTKQDSTDTKTEENSTSTDDKKKEEVELTEDLSEYEDIEWPDSTVTKLIPKPKSMVGKIKFDSDTSLTVKIANTSTDDYEEYIEECKKLGYTENYKSTDRMYMADNNNGYTILVRINSDYVMTIMVAESDATVGDMMDSSEDAE